ncbi:hypothetical protein ACNTMW_33320 [Planosporangium sp. 12N6]|uniref:hypothetical protein n=1 Tax=Planosporangium spinosum TaxID=3402278 RepID=UPI003CFA9DD8
MPSATPPRTRWPLLAELALTDTVVIEHDEIFIVNRLPPSDALAHTVLDQLAGEVSGYLPRQGYKVPNGPALYPMWRRPAEAA